MEILQIVAFALIATILVVLLKEHRPVLAMQLSIVVGVVIFLRLIRYLSLVLEFLTGMTMQANISLVYLNILLKIVGIAYIAEFGAQICRDAGEGATAGKVEFAGKLFILVMALPLISAVLETILKFIP
ncbi:MAG: stage III sporulation protein AD [Dethiobacter sp.]|nr:stage III sporulation protein AD [Dethiobacter sp.]